MAYRYAAFLVLTLGAAGQQSDLPVPPNYLEQLRERGLEERFLPVQPQTLEPSAEDRRRGWQLYHRDRNFEILPNSRPAPDEGLEVLRIVATPGEMESEPFSVYGLRNVNSIEVRPEVNATGESEWLRTAVKIEDVLFHPIQYGKAKTGVHDEVRDSSEKTYLRYPIFIHRPKAHALPQQ